MKPKKFRVGATQDDVLDWVAEEAVMKAITVLKLVGAPVTEESVTRVAKRIIDVFVEDLQREEPEFVLWLLDGATDR